ncbi:MAG: hydrogenase maturation protease [Dehalococcoidia bacterium]|nr:MAG: hydrogenase maturation protease [Dehalococcoidia bacterium]
MTERNSTVVVGLGNPLMADEGIGLYVVRGLLEASEQLPDTDIVEPGTSPMGVVHAIAGRRKAILVDCAYMREPAGTIRRFHPDEVVSTKEMTHLSLHEGDLLDVLELSKRLGEYPEEVVIFGIQPELIALGEGLSSALQERLQDYIAIINAEVEGSLVH